MDKHIRKLWTMLTKTAEGQQSLTKYAQMANHEGWKVHQDMMLILKGLIVEDMLTKRFTELSPIDKDVRQRAYAQVVEVIDFLHNPQAKAQNMTAIQTHNRRMEATRGTTDRE